MEASDDLPQAMETAFIGVSAASELRSTESHP